MLAVIRAHAQGRRAAELERATWAVENRLLDLRAGLALLLGYSPEETVLMSDTDLLETAARVIRRAQ